MRVVAGLYKGRRLRAPEGLQTRPTVERVREALFSMLGYQVQNAKVLDGYSGSGALGIEALSRGASSATFVEKSPGAAAILQDNLDHLGLTSSATQIVQRPLESSITALRAFGPFDIWLIDPPFALMRDGTAPKALARLVSAKLLAADGVVVLEYPSELGTPEIPALALQRLRRYGGTTLAWFGFELTGDSTSE